MGWPGPLTHRQFLIWQAWMNDEWNRPNRTDHYLMDVRREVRDFRRMFAKGLEALTAEALKIKFEMRRPPKPMTPEERDLLSRTVWLGMFGMDANGNKIGEGTGSNGSSNGEHR